MQVWNGSNWLKNGSTDVSGACPLQRNERTFQSHHYANEMMKAEPKAPPQHLLMLLP
jgi:hypothetical protein